MNDVKKNNESVIVKIGWSSGSKFTRQFIQLITQLIIARILSPQDFGLFSMVIVFSGLADIIKNLGLGASIIKTALNENKSLSSVFWLNLLSGIIILIFFQILAAPIATFFKREEVAPIVRVFSFTYLISSVNIVQESLLQKELDFKRLFIIETVSVILGGIIGVYLAQNGFGVWSLVWQFMFITISSTAIIWFSSKWRPLFYFNISKIKNHFRFGSYLLGHDLLSYCSRNIDTLLIGRYLGAKQLGIYSRAYFLMLQPVNLINQVLARVMFPVLVQYSNNKREIKIYYLKSIRFLAIIIFPIITFCFVMAKQIIILILGSQWESSVQIFKIFCIYSLIDSIGITTYWIYKATGNTDKMFRWGIYQSIIIITAILVGLKWGITGVALSYTSVFIVLLWIPGWHYCFKIINLKVTTLLKVLLPSFICTLITGVSALFLYNIYLHQFTLINQIIIMLLIWIVIYFLCALLIMKKEIIFFKSRFINYN